MSKNTMTDLPEETRIGRVALRVNDLAVVKEFYETVIGLELFEQDSGRAVLGAGEEELLVLIEDADAPARSRAEAGLFHTAFRVPDRAALGDVLARIEAHADLDGASDHGVSEALYLSDPEGNGIEVYRDRPEEDWETDADGHVAMPTQRLDLDVVRRAAAGNTTAPAGTTVGHVHLEATDLAASRRVYVDAFGMTVRQELATAVFLAAGGYHHHIGLNTWNHRSEPPQGRGLAWYELIVPDETVVEQLRDRMENDGAAVDTLDAGFAVTDPNGIRLRIRP